MDWGRGVGGKKLGSGERERRFGLRGRMWCLLGLVICCKFRVGGSFLFLAGRREG